MGFVQTSIPWTDNYFTIVQQDVEPLPSNAQTVWFSTWTKYHEHNIESIILSYPW